MECGTYKNTSTIFLKCDKTRLYSSGRATMRKYQGKGLKVIFMRGTRAITYKTQHTPIVLSFVLSRERVNNERLKFIKRYGL